MLKAKGSKYDWVTICIYIALVVIGWINIYSASFNEASTSFFDVNQVYTKQLMFICLSVLLIIFILAIEAKFYERFSSIIYLIALFSLLGLFLFGKNINGATSWYAIGGFTIQPSEFTKFATALALAKYVSDIQIDLLKYQDQIKSLIIIFLPAILIIPQPDPGSALVYLALIFPLYREGLHAIYLLLGFIVAAIFIATLTFGTIWVSLLILLITGFIVFKAEKKSMFKYGVLAVACIGFSISVNFIFENVLEQRHRDRFNIVLGKQVDIKSIGYNTNQSEIAIGSGGWTGKGWLQGTQTKGKFVPEQDTDYIFSTVGEEWGFIGTLLTIILFALLITRISFRADKQVNHFRRIYCNCFASLLFIHFFINIGMSIGLVPSIGIPLPFISYGGTSLLFFSVMFFIYLNFDSSRLRED